MTLQRHVREFACIHTSSSRPSRPSLLAPHHPLSAGAVASAEPSPNTARRCRRHPLPTSWAVVATDSAELSSKDWRRERERERERERINSPGNRRADTSGRDFRPAGSFGRDVPVAARNARSSATSTSGPRVWVAWCKLFCASAGP